MSKPASDSVIRLEIVRDEIRLCRKKEMTYKKIGRLYGVGGGVIWNIEHGVNPTSHHVRTALGLGPMVLPEMYHEVKVCSNEDCDVPFVPNSPLRTKCFECSPFKGKKKDEGFFCQKCGTVYTPEIMACRICQPKAYADLFERKAE